MPPKRKDLLNPKSKGKAKPKTQDPQSEHDFLEAADEFEQAAGKWRAGDAAKAVRFFNRAIDMYTEGLKRFPGSFDLAYNKANLEYNMCEDDRISSQLGDKAALLQETLESHRAAMALNADNIDVRFNTAQVLLSLAETVLESETQQTAKVPARSLLEEAVDLFTACLVSQQQEYAKIRAEFAEAQATQEQQESEQPGVSNEGIKEEEMETASTVSSSPGEWAFVEEPLTPETMLETCTAHLNALTTLLSLYQPVNSSEFDARVQSGMDTAGLVVPTLIDLVQDSPFQKTEEEPTGPTLSIGPSNTSESLETNPKDDTHLAVANFRAALTEVEYRKGQKTEPEYAAMIESIYADLKELLPTSDQSPANVNALAAYADALMELASAIADNPLFDPTSPHFATSLETQWTALNQAQKTLTKLSTGTTASMLSTSRLADTFLARGDTELFRFRIALMEIAKPAWSNSKKVLVANAGVFYRGARTYAEKAEKEGMRRTADAKAVVAEVLKEVEGNRANAVVAKVGWKGKADVVKRVLEQMVEEGILGRVEAEGVLGLVQ